MQALLLVVNGIAALVVLAALVGIVRPNWLRTSRKTAVFILIVAWLIAVATAPESGPGRSNQPTVSVTSAPPKTEPPAAAASQPAVRPTVDAPPAYLPGLTSGDLKVTLQQRGLNCSGPTMRKDDASWVCERNDATASYHVEFTGAPTRIEFVTGTVMQYARPSDALAVPFLGFLATLPFDGSSPEQAKEWVSDVIRKGGKKDVWSEKDFGSALFRVSGAPQARTLDIRAKGSIRY